MKGMKVGFIEPATNPEANYEKAVEAAKQFAGMEVVKAIAPEVLKVPVAAKKLFTEQDVDCVVVFIVPYEGQEHEMSLLQEKIIDVEVYAGKYVFLAVATQQNTLEAINHALTQAAEFTGGINTGLPFTLQSEAEVKDILGEAPAEESHKLF